MTVPMLPFGGSLPAPEFVMNQHDLRDVAQKGSDSIRWESGGGFPEYQCGCVQVYEGNCPPDQLQIGDGVSPGTCAVANFRPFVITRTWQAEPADPGEARKMAELILDLETSSALEYAMLLDNGGVGSVPEMPTLEDVYDLDQDGYTLVRDSDALGYLQWQTPGNGMCGRETQRTVTPGKGTILMSPPAFYRLESKMDLVDGVWRTEYGHWPVVIGNFQPAEVIYAVPGMIDVYVGDIETEEFFDRKDNVLSVVASRLGMVTWHFCGARKITLPEFAVAP